MVAVVLPTIMHVHTSTCLLKTRPRPPHVYDSSLQRLVGRIDLPTTFAILVNWSGLWSRKSIGSQWSFLVATSQLHGSKAEWPSHVLSVGILTTSSPCGCMPHYKTFQLTFPRFIKFYQQQMNENSDISRSDGLLTALAHQSKYSSFISLASCERSLTEGLAIKYQLWTKMKCLPWITMPNTPA